MGTRAYSWSVRSSADSLDSGLVREAGQPSGLGP